MQIQKASAVPSNNRNEALKSIYRIQEKGI